MLVEFVCLSSETVVVVGCDFRLSVCWMICYTISLCFVSDLIILVASLPFYLWLLLD